MPSQSPAQSSSPRPFTIDVPQDTVDWIVRRVRDARWPARLDASDWRYGVNWDYMRELAAYWVDEYDWRRAEARLNRYPQFLASLGDAATGDYEIHFYHVQAERRDGAPEPIPLVLTHGWPGSVVEFQDVIGPLTDPASFGGSATDQAFDLVVPSLPGFGFSSKPDGKPIGPAATARMWHQLMTEVLGYERYGAQGGDWGNVIATQLARQFPDSLIGIHLNAAGAAPGPPGQQTEEERAWAQAAAAFRATELDYFGEQQRKPQTVSFALSDNPLGAAAWIIEKFKAWSDLGDSIEDAFSKDQLLTNVMLYLATDSISTAHWFYRGFADEGAGGGGRIEVPTGFAAFPREMPALSPPQTVLERGFRIVRYTQLPRGGHFAALEQPGLYADDVRAFFSALNQ